MTREEAAYVRTLRDLEYGHITLTVSVDRYDPITGEPLSEPAPPDVASDRLPAAGTPNPGGAWWAPMLSRGHLELVDHGSWRMHYRVTAAGRAWLAQYGNEEETHG